MAAEKGSPGQKPKKELDIGKLSKVKNRKVARAFRKRPTEEPPPKLNIAWRKLWLNVAIITVFNLLLYGLMLFGNTVFNDSINIQIMSSAPQPDVLFLQLITEGLKHPLAQPFVQATFAWDALSFPGQPAWYHFVNIALHIVSCIYLALFVFQVFIRLKEDKRISFDPYIGSLFIAIIFACHPFAGDTVSYISARSGLLVACNCFLALNLFMLGFYATEVAPIVCLYFLAILAIVLALFCSVQAMAIPVAILILALLLKPAYLSWKLWCAEKWQDFVMYSLPTIGVFAALFTPVRQILDNGVDLPLLSRADYLLSQASALITYFLRFLVAPFGMSIDNAPFQQIHGDSNVVGYLSLCIIGMLGACLIHFKKFPLARFGGTLALLVIITNFIMVQHEIVSSQRYYFALAGIAILVGSLALEYVPINRKSITISGIIILMMCSVTIWRESTWLTDISLWQSARAAGVKNPRIMGMLAHAYYGAGRLKEANELASSALVVDPNCAPANETFALTLLPSQIHGAQAQNTELPVTALKKAVETARRDRTADEKLSWYQYELAEAAMRGKDWKTAREAALGALKTRPGSGRMHLVLGSAYLAERDFGQAFKELEEGYQLDRANLEFLEALAQSCLDLGAPAGVAYGYSIAKQAVRINGSYQCRLLLARAALMLGKTREAAEQLGGIETRGMQDPEALWLMSWAQRQLHHENASQELAKRALKAEPKIDERLPQKEIDLRQWQEAWRHPGRLVKGKAVQDLSMPRNAQNKHVANPGGPTQDAQPQTAPSSTNTK